MSKKENKDLLEKIEESMISQKIMKSDEISLRLTPRQLEYVYIWIKTAYANEEYLDEVLDLKINEKK